jgi:hypothetical protein
MIEWQNLLQMIVIGAAIVVFGGWIMAHLFWHFKPSRLDSLDDLMTQFGRGQPILIYFYSNF